VVSAEKVKIHAKFDINRKDFGIVYAGKADDLIRDEVVIELKLAASPEA
jgi:polyisoprenoid-binding protein YceI